MLCHLDLGLIIPSIRQDTGGLQKAIHVVYILSSYTISISRKDLCTCNAIPERTSANDGKKTHKHISHGHVVFENQLGVQTSPKHGWQQHGGAEGLHRYNTTATNGRLKSVLSFSSSGKSLPLQSHSTQVSVEDLPSKTSVFDNLSAGYARCQASPHKWPARQAKGFQGPNMNKNCFEVATPKATWKYGARIKINIQWTAGLSCEQAVNEARHLISAILPSGNSISEWAVWTVHTCIQICVYVILCWLSILLVFTYQSLSISLSIYLSVPKSLLELQGWWPREV